jgi:hypothetical protein
MLKLFALSSLAEEQGHWFPIDRLPVPLLFSCTTDQLLVPD